MCRLLCVEHVAKEGKPLLYLVFEYLDSDLKKYIDEHGNGQTGIPIPRADIKVCVYLILIINDAQCTTFYSSLTLIVMQRLMYQLCKGVSYCHSHGVMHR